MENFYKEKKIYYHDTDCGGVVYYANYLKYMEEAWTDFCLKYGVNLKELAEQGTYFVIAHIEVDYKCSAHYQDVIKIFTYVEKIRRLSVHYSQEIKNAENLLVKAMVIWACVDKDFRPKRLPDIIRSWK
ncbi:MAG: hypothetical protein DRP78_06460 [Candidatus Omnitrophota bacterium]|nr:MAG: hypothetical protein DRP78_06460 [Candidatus Omnitrophota bacterium]